MAVQNLVAPNGPLITSLEAAARRCALPRSPDVAIYMHDLAGGGVERQTITLAQELLAGGLSVVVVLHRMHGELRDMIPSSIPVVDLRSRRTLHDIPLLARLCCMEPELVAGGPVATHIGKPPSLPCGTALPCRSNTMPNIAITFPSPDIASRTGRNMTLR